MNRICDMETFWSSLFAFIYKNKTVSVDFIVYGGLLEEEVELKGLMELLCTILVDYTSPLRLLDFDALSWRHDDLRRINECLRAPTCRLIDLHYEDDEEDALIVLISFSKCQRIKIPKQDRILTMLYAVESQHPGSLGKLHKNIIQRMQEFI